MHAGREYRLIQVRVEPASPVENMTLAELNWRDEHSATVVAIERQGGNIPMPRGKERLQAGDVLLVLCPVAEADKLEALAKPMLERF